ncbi:MBL fold metallo-hydrolase [Paenibacillus kandeliae]|uniref:MBL fold metallo-hydrolase n=1 Tax=Paenibacillus kandeliae TaxID=3231269 RepID=UPI0034576475
MKIQLIRNASLWLEYNGLHLLVDPMLGEQGAYPPIMNSDNERRNPLVPLPGALQQWQKPDIIVLTHLHNDHWDAAAVEALDKSIPVWCQPGDRQRIEGQGFTSVTEIQEHWQYKGVQLYRTSGHHGTGEIGEKMGNVSGFVLQAEHEPILYIAGDTIWCSEVEQALHDYKPDVTIVNAGAAQFVDSEPIIMDQHDVQKVCTTAPYSKVIAVHMEAINHCLLTRRELAEFAKEQGLSEQLIIPQDGEQLQYK